MLSDDELVEQILLGNENAAEELIKRYYTSILRYCRWHCSNLEKAEDLTQETFLKLFKNLSGYKGKKKFKAYLYTIANHLCIDESRKVGSFLFLHKKLDNGRQKQRLLIYGMKEKKLYCVLFQTICLVSERFLVKLHWKIFIYFIFLQRKE